MRRFISVILCLFAVSAMYAVDMNARKERKAILDGNAAYRGKDYKAALSDYEQALKINPGNITALFNKALATAMIAEGMPAAQAEDKSKLLAQASKDFESVAKHTSDNPALAARANYNRGNISFKDKKYQEAIDYYKNALRLNPNDNQARRNMRIAQQNLPKQNQDKNQDKNRNQDKKQDKEKDKDKNQDKNRDNNKDQDKNQDKDQNKDRKDQKDQRQQPRQQKQDMNNQAADRILKRSTDKENQTRKNFTIGNPNKRSRGW